MRNWGFGLIGCGSIAETHAAAIRGIPNARLVAVANRTEDRARELAGRERCRWTTDYRELLRSPDVDIVCVTTPSGSHATIGLDVLAAGKHLVMEKPIAMTSTEAKALIHAARERGVQLTAVSQSRFAESFRAIRRALDDRALGKLLLLEASVPFHRTQAYYDGAPWRGTIGQDGGALMNQGIHQIDLLLWFGGAVESVYGLTATQTHRMEAEDMGLALVKFRNGAFGSIMASTSIRPGFPPALGIYGENGTIRTSGFTISHWSLEGWSEPAPSADPSVGPAYGGVADPRGISSECHRLQLIDLIEAAASGASPAVTGHSGWNAVRLVEAIARSSATGQAVRLEDDDE